MVGVDRKLSKNIFQIMHMLGMNTIIKNTKFQYDAIISSVKGLQFAMKNDPIERNVKIYQKVIDLCLDAINKQVKIIPHEENVYSVFLNIWIRLTSSNSVSSCYTINMPYNDFLSITVKDFLTINNAAGFHVKEIVKASSKK